MEKKHPKFEALLNDFTTKTFGRSRDGAKCVTCGSDKVSPEDFIDDLSRKEFGISFMCQKCQDDVFSCSENKDEY